MSDEKIAMLEKKIASLEMINKVLLGRVERSIDSESGSQNPRENDKEDQIPVDNHTIELQAQNKQLAEMLENLQHATDQLVQNEKMAALGSLVAGVAHEVNTPVGVGLTAASHFQVICREFQQSFNNGTMKKSDLTRFLASCEESSSIIVSNLIRASELITSFKRVAVDSSCEQQQTIDIKKYLKDIIVTLTPQLRNTKVSIHINCPDDLWIHTQPGAFSQIVTNLVINALMHAFDDVEEGLIDLSIQVVGEKKQDICMIFADNGKGIPAQNLQKIFDPFFTTKRGRGGSGLGLNLIYNIISKNLNGSITCESTVGKGTRFIMNFPECLAKPLGSAA